MLRPAALVLCGLALLPGCQGRVSMAQRAFEAVERIPYVLDAGASVRVPYSLYPEVVYEVVIRGPQGSSVVPNLFVADSERLALAVDSLVFVPGFNAGGALVGLLRFHGLSGRLDTLPVPRGYSPNLTSLATSPSGRYLAYVEVDGAEPPYGVVREVGDRSEVVRTPPVPADGMEEQYGTARWIGANRFFLAIAVDASQDRWVRFSGDVVSRHFSRDTAAPDR